VLVEGSHRRGDGHGTLAAQTSVEEAVLRDGLLGESERFERPTESLVGATIDRILRPDRTALSASVHALPRNKGVDLSELRRAGPQAASQTAILRCIGGLHHLGVAAEVIEPVWPHERVGGDILRGGVQSRQRTVLGQQTC